MVVRAVQQRALVILLGCSAGCSSSPTAPPPGGPQTLTVSGAATTSDTGACSNSGHFISTGTGTITVALVQSSAAAVKVQVCHPTAVNHALECTVPPFAVVSSATPVTATLRGGSSQTVTVFPAACAVSPPAASSVTYTISITYPAG